MEFNYDGKKLLKELEGFRAIPYYCPADVLTVGWGHTGKDIVKNMHYTKEECEILFNKDTKRFCEDIKKLLTCELNNNQFSALVCFVYNVGTSAFRKSALLRRLNNKEIPNIVARSEFPRWRWKTIHGKKEEDQGLKNRRISELALFTRPME